MKLKRAYLRLLTDDKTYNFIIDAQLPHNKDSPALRAFRQWCVQCDELFITCPCMFNRKRLIDFTIED